VGHDDELAWCGGGVGSGGIGGVGGVGGVGVGGGATGASGIGGDGGARSGGEGADGSGGASGASGLGGIGGIGCIGGSGAWGEPGGGAVSLGARSGPVPEPCVPKTWARALFFFSGPIPPAASVPTPAAAITASARANAAHRRLGLAHMASSPLLWPRGQRLRRCQPGNFFPVIGPSSSQAGWASFL